MKIDRLISIILILVERKKVKAQELAEEFQVSIRTIQRDMETLSLVGIPLYGEVGKNGGYQITDNFKLDKSFLSLPELDALKEVLKGIGETPFNHSLGNFIRKLSLLSDSNSSSKILQIDSDPWDKGHYKYLDSLYLATENSREILFTYCDSQGKTTERQVEPYRLIMKGASWYLHGYCLERRDYRTFNIKRISSLVLGCKFQERADFNQTDKTSLRENDHTIAIKIRLPTGAREVLPVFLNPTESMKDGDDLLLSFTVSPSEWLLSFFVSHGHVIELLEPISLREEVFRRIEKCYENYRTPLNKTL
jgi:predicted DNA-binding transcriptional regulator YafY